MEAKKNSITQKKHNLDCCNAGARGIGTLVQACKMKKIFNQVLLKQFPTCENLKELKTS